MAGEVTHNSEKSRYEIVLEGGTAFSQYVRHGDVLSIVHTVTPSALRGQGIAGRLVREMLADIRRQGLKVDPQCSFITAYFADHPEDHDLLAKA
jgi:predicted GNAT family acetyltransferase